MRKVGSGLIATLGALVLTFAVGLVYRQAALSYFFNDDFQWLEEARRFNAINFLHLERYNHFYRPVIEIYFYLGRRFFGCAALPFHMASIGVHLCNTFLLALFARALTGSLWFAFLSALFFCLQPSYLEAVAWIGAITDLLPAFWYLLALWMYLRFLQGRGERYYLLSLATFLICLLTHESSATLLPMMVILDATRLSDATPVLEDRPRPSKGALAKRSLRYVPFAVLLTGYLVLEYVVNSRSYLIREGHYGFGWHVVPHIFLYIVALLVWKPTLVSYVLIPVLMAAVMVWGTPRLRLFVLWMVVTLVPAAFFTWANQSRYLYLSAAGFALLLAELVLKGQALATEWISPRAAHVVTLVVATALAGRFALFARKGAQDFRERTRPYERLVAAVAGSNPAAPPDGVVYVNRLDAQLVPRLYLDAAIQATYCGSEVHAVVR